MRTKEYLAVIRPVGELLGIETMYFPDEVRGVKDVENTPVEVDVTDRELSIAEQLVESMSSEWEPDRYHDTYRERVLELVEAKARGEDVVVEPEAAPAPVGDLMAALEASVKAARERKEGGAPPAAAAKAVSDEPGQEASGGADDLADLSKDELYDLAAEAGVPGRSKMTKDELLDALRKRKAA
jgi:DNA end-binding protein Ku